MNQFNDLPPVLTAQDVADLLHLHLKTVQNYARAGIIPAKRIGGEWRFLRDQVEDWLRHRGKDNH